MTSNSGVFTLTKMRTQFNTDGSFIVILNYANTANGHTVVARIINIPANASDPITDQFGTVISATVPAGLASAISTFQTQLDTALNAGAQAGKLDL